MSRRPRRPRWTLLLLSSLTTFLLPAMAAAQDGNKSGEFSVQRFHPAPGPRNYLTVEGARTQGKMAWSGGLFVNYSDSPFRVRSCVSQTDCSTSNKLQPNDVNVIKTMVTGDVLASLTPFPRLQLGLRVPITYVKGDGFDTTTGGPAAGGLTGTGIGDPMIEGKIRLIGEPTSPFVLGIAPFLSGPVGSATAKDKYIGDSSVVAGLRGILDGQAGPLGYAVNLAGLYRGKESLGSVEMGPEFRYGGAVGFQASPIFRVLAEGFGSTKFSKTAGTSSLEVDGAIQIHPLNSGIHLTVGGGPGVLQGVGVPTFRGFVGFMYVREVGDTDGDGINDNEDKCITEAEDKDGFQDADGCPDPDNDGDGIKDEADKCINQPETMNGFEDEDGCPDDIPDRDKDGIADNDDQCPDDGGPEVIRAKGANYGCPDRDKDGVPDKADKCPDQPEDTDGFQDVDGCPDPDNDGDGVPDTEDECVDVPGTRAKNGCPDPDSDGDGIPDSRDKCPNEPETYNGYKDDDGCADKAPGSLVEVTDEGIKILDRVEFATGSDKITGPKSFKVLDQVASVLVANQGIFLVEVAGHTDNAGDAGQNKALSQKRAEAVVKYLVDKRSVDPKKLQAKGYGAEKPIADNTTKKGKQQNRRVEFNILKSTKKTGGAAPATPVAAPPAPLPAPWRTHRRPSRRSQAGGASFFVESMLPAGSTSGAPTRCAARPAGRPRGTGWPRPSAAGAPRPRATGARRPGNRSPPASASARAAGRGTSWRPP
jgi:OmpA-OmpF porin, OOP family